MNSIYMSSCQMCLSLPDSFFNVHVYIVFGTRCSYVTKALTTMENLNSLSFEGVGFHDLVQMQHVLCLIGSSSSLQFLLIEPVRTSINLTHLKSGTIGHALENCFKIQYRLLSLHIQFSNIWTTCILLLT